MTVYAAGVEPWSAAYVARLTESEWCALRALLRDDLVVFRNLRGCMLAPAPPAPPAPPPTGSAY